MLTRVAIHVYVADVKPQNTTDSHFFSRSATCGWRVRVRRGTVGGTDALPARSAPPVPRPLAHAADGSRHVET